MDPIEMLAHERHARRLRAQFAGDRLARAAIALDLAIRRVAWRLLRPAQGVRQPRAARGRASCRS